MRILRRSGLGLGMAVALATMPSAAAAQVAWDAPFLVHPHAPSGGSIFLAEPSGGDGLGGLFTWRSAPVPTGWGFRAGIASVDRGDDEEIAIFGGGDVSGTILHYSDEVPVDLIWVAGAGVAVGDDLLLSAPFGAIAGWDLRTESASFRPYVGPRLSLDAFFGDDEDLDLSFSVDGGIDVDFEGFLVRFGLTLGDREALAIGLSLPGLAN